MQIFDLRDSIINKYPVVLGISCNYGNIRVHSIVVEKSQRNQGIGTAVMNEIIAFADSNNLTITLTPDSSLGGNLRRLKKFYRRLGFKKYTEFFFTDALIREPNKQGR